jgi:hypothetical protein
MKKWLPEALAVFAILAVVSYGFSQTWTPSTFTPYPTYDLFSVAASGDGQKMMTVSSSTIAFVSTNSGSTWQSKQMSVQIGQVACSVDGSKLMGIWAARSSSYVYVSTNWGNTWIQTSAPWAAWNASACSADGTKLAAGVYGGQIYTSTNFGTTWQTNNSPQKTWLRLASSADGSKLAAVDGMNDVIYISTNSGPTWIPSNSPSNIWTSVAFSADGTQLVATGPFGTCISFDSGNSWTTNAIMGVSVASSAGGSKLLIGNYVSSSSTYYWVYTSTNFGLTWETNNLPLNYAHSCAVASSADGNKLVIVGGTPYIYTSYTPAAPQLDLADSDTNLALSWLVPSTNFVVQQSPDLVSWSSITDAPSLNLTNLNKELTLSPSNSGGFFRLISQ